MEPEEFEPSASCLQGRRSPSWATAPYKPLRRGTIPQPPDRQSGALPKLCYGAIKSRVRDLNPCSRLMRPLWNLSNLTRKPSSGLEPETCCVRNSCAANCAMTAGSGQPETIRHLQLGRLICCQLHHAHICLRTASVASPSAALLTGLTPQPYGKRNHPLDSRA